MFSAVFCAVLSALCSAGLKVDENSASPAIICRVLCFYSWYCSCLITTTAVVNGLSRFILSLAVSGRNPAFWHCDSQELELLSFKLLRTSRWLSFDTSFDCPRTWLSAARWQDDIPISFRWLFDTFQMTLWWLSDDLDYQFHVALSTTSRILKQLKT